MPFARNFGQRFGGLQRPPQADVALARSANCLLAELACERYSSLFVLRFLKRYHNRHS